MIVDIYTENASDKIQYILIIKTLRKDNRGGFSLLNKEHLIKKTNLELIQIGNITA